MRWTPEAEAMIKKVPFCVRKKVRLRIEKEAADLGKTVVGIREVKDSQKRYLSGMAAEVKGYQLDVCFGPSGCVNRASISDELVKDLGKVLQKADLLSFLKEQVGEDLKFNHEFRVTLSDCPNACSQPQIKDIGIIGSEKIHSLGYWYVLLPVGTGAIIMLIVALPVKKISDNRNYPEYWM